MTADWLSLAPGETVDWDGRPRLSAALPSLATGALLVVAAVAAVVVLGDGLPVRVGAVAVALLGVATAAWAYLRVVNTEYVVTTRALYAKSGVLGLSVTSVPVERVQDSSFSQSVTGSLFGYGTVRFDTAGGDAFAFRRVGDPAEVRRLVSSSRDRGTEVPGSLDQWRAVREEVRALREALDSR